MSGSWSALLEQALGASTGPAVPAPVPPAVERLAVRGGEVVARVRGGFEVSLIRPVFPDHEWERACAALASQPVFRARLLAGELPPEAARVFSLLGLDLVPRGWGDLVAHCSCDEWRGRCAHLAAAVAALGREADRDPFTLAAWCGRARRELVARVGAAGVREEAEPPAGPPEADAAEESDGGGSGGAVAGTAAGFWSAPPLPSPFSAPSGAGARVRAAAPGTLADEIPAFTPART
ncbi:hypothetical protein [Nocardiopsis sp. YSL2]|uniref:SWIM zinc finger family protein n=1 Tax=Nocardiopsis sp. YSL2 TaxID=2939492 RepID=UPI0026F46820|nr:hypothetical protein [Nocardiopsis sp. YSL2]